MPEQSAIQQVLQNATAVQTAGQAGVPSGTNNGNPNTVYNTAPPTQGAPVASPVGTMVPPQGANSPIAPDAYIGAVLQGIANWNPPMPGSYAGGAGQLNGMLGNILGNIRNPPPRTGGVFTPGTGTTTPPSTPFTPGTGNSPANFFADDPVVEDHQWCVTGSMWLEGSVRAQAAVKGLVSTTHTPEEGFKLTPIESVGGGILQPCVKVVTDRGAKLSCSNTTPFTVVGATADEQTVLAPEMLGRMVYVKRKKKTTVEKVVSVEDIGEQLVIPISFGGRSFPAGEEEDALIYSHNIYKIPGSGQNLFELYDNITTQFGHSYGDTPYITTQSQQYNPATVWGDTLPTSMAPVQTYDPSYTWGDTLPNAPFPTATAAPATGSPALGQSGFTGGTTTPAAGTPAWQQALNALVNPTGALIDVGGEVVDWLKGWWNNRGGN